MIEVSDKYRIGIDRYQWIVYEKQEPKKEERKSSPWQPKTYHPKLSQATQWIIHQNLALAIPTEIDALVTALSRSQVEICEAIERAGVPEYASEAYRRIKHETHGNI